MNTARLPLLAACLAGALALALARPAAAGDPDPAQTSFDRGVAHIEAGRYDQGCPAVEESYRLDPRPGTLFTLAECEALRGRLATALARFDEYLVLYPALSAQQKRKQGDRAKVARTQRAVLARDVPELKLVLPPDAPADTVVERDGVAVPRAALGTSIPVDPGEYVVKARAPSGTALELRVRLGKGEKKTVTLEARAAQAPAPEPPAAPALADAAPAASVPPSAPSPERGSSGRRIGAYAAGGLGVVGLIAGSLTGALALGRKSVVDENCADTACNHEGKLAADEMSTLGLLSTIGFGVGVAGLGAAAVLLLTEPSEEQGTATGRRWVSAGLVPMGAGGAALELRGAW